MSFSYPPSDIPKIKPEIKKRWIEALRSGEYEQAIGVLRKTDGVGRQRYCCLGVLCDVVKFDDALLGTFTNVERPRWSAVTNRFGDHATDPPEIVDRYVTSGPYQDWTALMERNDGDGGKPQSFAQIANLIERHG